ncbi:MAG: cell division protein FtsQ/DivIB [Candidatus Margulisiibacteriota bacterium]
MYYFLSLPTWQIREIIIEGTNILSAEEVRTLSSIPFSENLFFANFSRTKENLKKITAIKDFHIYRIPPATILIKITERKPIAVVLIENKSFVVDSEGYILNRSPSLSLNVPNLDDLPTISGIGSEEVINKERISPKIAHLLPDLILEIHKLLGSRKIALDLGNFKNLGFLLDDILFVKIGRDENLKEKIEVFKALIPILAGKWAQIEYVDVRYPQNPVVKYK